MTPYYADASVELFHGDALEVMAVMPDESVDVVVTSPPYNMGLVPGGNGRGMYRPGANAKAGRFRDGYGIHGDAMPQDEYDAWQRECLAEMWRVARLGVFYNHRPRVEHGVLRWPLGLNFGIPLRQVIVWDRGTGIDVNLRAYCTRQEHIYVFAKPAFKLVDHAASGQGDVWRLGMDTEEKEHPAPFPVSLPSKIIATNGARSVLDPFVGSGTTLRAAKDAGIAGIGVEIEERWCRRAVERLAQEALQWTAMSSHHEFSESDTELAFERTMRAASAGADPEPQWHEFVNLIYQLIPDGDVRGPILGAAARLQSDTPASHFGAQGGPSLDVEWLAHAIHLHREQSSAKSQGCDHNCAPGIGEMYGRLPDEPDAERLAEAGGNVLDGRRIGSVRLYRNTITPDDWRAIAAEYARLGMAPEPPE